MGGAIDNFTKIYDNLLKFDKEGEFYLVLILKRRKDTKGRMVEGVNEDNRLIKHYFVYDKEYLKRKEAAIKQLCEQNNARAYILPQRRSHDLVMWALHNKTGEILKSGAKNTHFDHLIRSCVAGMHEVPADAKWHKRWVLDIDRDDEVTRDIASRIWVQDDYHYPCARDGVKHKHLPEANINEKVDNLAYYLHEYLKASFVSKKSFVNGMYGVVEDDLNFYNILSKRWNYMPDINLNLNWSNVLILPTPHGWHIVTPPFNREKKAMEEYFGFEIPKDWIKPDAMALMFAPETIVEGEE